MEANYYDIYTSSTRKSLQLALFNLALWRTVKKVFCVLRDNLLDFSQSHKEISSTLRTAIKSFKSFPLSITQVSSAYNKVNNNLETLHMSFIYKINKSGPRIEPLHTIWGASQVSFFAYHGGPPQIIFLHTIWGLPQINLFAYCMGAPSWQFLRLL